MKFFHLSDLHIGKNLHEQSLLEDQRYILWQILDMLEQQRPDGIIIAGDIYDKSIPSAEAVNLFDEFLTELSKRELAVIMISGNHDSSERLNYASTILKKNNIYVKGIFDGKLEKVEMCDEYGNVNLYLLPFIKPFEVRRYFPDSQIENSYDLAVKAVVENTKLNQNERNILVAHQFITGAVKAESESIMVGGLDNVGADTFDAFDYVALGHIHRPQRICRDTVRYCGTPLAYSLDVSEGEKSVTVVELKDKNEIEITKLPLKPLRGITVFKGTMEEALSQPITEDYAKVILQDDKIIVDAVPKLRTIFPQLLLVEFENQRKRAAQGVQTVIDIADKKVEELFADFYMEQNGEEISAADKELVKSMVEEVIGGY